MAGLLLTPSPSPPLLPTLRHGRPSSAVRSSPTARLTLTVRSCKSSSPQPKVDPPAPPRFPTTARHVAHPEPGTPLPIRDLASPQPSSSSLVPAFSLLPLLTSAPALADVIGDVAEGVGEGGGASLGYSQSSYYATLGLFIISIPGLWSLIKRATKSKIVRRTFEIAGPTVVEVTGGKSMAQVAGEITSILNRQNYRVAEAKDVVTFEGDIQPSRSQAAFLVFCTALSLASVALVLSITNPDVGEWWYSIVALSPLAGLYYWRKAARKEQIQVKIVISDDGKTADVVMQGDEDEVERVRREMNFMDKGLEYVKGIFEG